MRTVNLNLLIAALLMGGIFLWKSRPKVTTVDVSQVERTSAAVNGLTVARAPSAAAPHAVVAKPLPVVKALDPAPHAVELAMYTLLHRKVFLNEGESAEKSSLLKNASVLRAMGVRLVRPPGSEAAAGEQNTAIEMLIEALRSGDSEVASEVLKGVIKDSQIEDGQLEMSIRSNLAGIKAEILFQWSALRPTQAQELATLLPGPVSRKIWQNVIDAQTSNVAESVDTDL